MSLASSEADAGEAPAVVGALLPVHCWALAESRERRSIIVRVRLGHVIDEDLLLLATRRTLSRRLVERFRLVESIAILSAQLIGVQVLLGGPRRLVPELRVCLITASLRTRAVTLSLRVIELVLANGSFLGGSRLDLRVGLRVRDSESGVPFLVDGRMRRTGVNRHMSPCAIATRGRRSRRIEVRVVRPESLRLEPSVRILELLFLVEALSRNVSVSFLQLAVCVGARDEAGIPGRRIVLELGRRLLAHVVVRSPIAVVGRPGAALAVRAERFLIDGWSSMSPLVLPRHSGM